MYFLIYYVILASCYIANNCNKNAQCVHSTEEDEFVCKCNPGFEGDGFKCELISCAIENNCDPHASCNYDENLGKSKCVCSPGYEGDGFNCKMTGNLQMLTKLIKLISLERT